MGAGRQLAAALCALAMQVGAMAQEQATAIVGADVLTMEGGGRIRDAVVVIRGARIEAVGPRGTTQVPAGARVIDGSGKVLMPGLVDMHVHVVPEPGRPGDPAQRALAVMLAHGVTTIRSMAGAPQHIALRQAIEEGRVVGPRLYAGTTPLNDQNTPSPDAARRAVREARRLGFDLVKSHHVTDVATWEAVQDEAKRNGLPTAGHVTDEVGLARAVAAGQQIEHLDGAIAALLPSAGEPFGQLPPPAVLRQVAALPDAAFDTLAQRLATARSWQVPTLAIFERLADVTTPTAQLAAAPEMRWVPDGALRQWAQQRDGFLKSGFTAEDGARFRDVRRRLVHAYAKAGVPMMAGSDTAQSFLLWGPGLVEELQALAQSGLGNEGALRAATIVPRDYFRSLPNGGSSLGWKADFGTVQAGARADLVLLDADPVRDLKTLLRPGTVVAAGRVYDRERLDALLAQAAMDAKRPPPTGCAPGLPPDARCGTVMVPENRADPQSRRIPIRYAVIPARDGAAKHAPLVSLPGGPGLGGVQSAAGVAQLFRAHNATRDLLLIDQRGTGASNRLQCPSPADEDPMNALSPPSPQDAARCRGELERHADLRFYATREAVLDMEQVRATLGYDKLDLFGMSYGSRVALDYLRMFPDRVGHTVIRAAAPPSMQIPLFMPRDTQHSFDLLAATCREQPACNAKHPRMEADLQRVLARLDAGGVPVTFTDPRTKAPMAGRLDRNSFGVMLFFLLYVPELYVQVPPLLEHAAAGDFSPLVQAVSPLLFGLDDQVASGLRLSVVCTEDVARIDPARIDEATRGTFIGRFPVDQERAACALWPRASVPADFVQPVRSDKPVFIISGSMDPIAGAPWADDIARTLPNSRRVTVAGASHLPPLPGCTGMLVQRFLDGEPLKDIDMACVAESRMLPLRP